MLIALFLSGMRWRTYALLLNIGGALSMFSGRALFSLRRIRRSHSDNPVFVGLR